MIHIRFYDFIFIFIYPIFYVSLVWIYYGLSSQWVYSALNPEKGIAAIVYIGCFIYYYVGFFIFLGISYAKMLLFGFLKKKFQHLLWVSKEKKSTTTISKKMDDQELQNMALTSTEAINIPPEDQQQDIEKLEEVPLDDDNEDQTTKPSSDLIENKNE